MAEEDSVGGMKAIRLAIVDGDPVAVAFGHTAGRARAEECFSCLRYLLHETIHLSGGSLVEARLIDQMERSNGLDETQYAESIGVGGVLRLFKGDLNVALSGEVVNLVGLHFLDDLHQAGRVRHIAVMEDEAAVGVMRIFVERIDACSIERGRSGA